VPADSRRRPNLRHSGYNDNKDARQVHPALRPPVDPVELEIDPRTGMKVCSSTGPKSGCAEADCRTTSPTSKVTGTPAVLASAGLCKGVSTWADGLARAAMRTSCTRPTAYSASSCAPAALSPITGPLSRAQLHTLEDLSAHSNWCELALQKLGHRQTYAHVGDNVRIRAPSGEMVAPLVTGTFVRRSSADFATSSTHSRIGLVRLHPFAPRRSRRPHQRGLRLRPQ
jgi:hypothetical protein